MLASIVTLSIFQISQDVGRRVPDLTAQRIKSRTFTCNFCRRLKRKRPLYSVVDFRFKAFRKASTVPESAVYLAREVCNSASAREYESADWLKLTQHLLYIVVDGEVLRRPQRGHV